MASTASRIGAVALRSTSRIRPRCAHMRSPWVQVHAFHPSPFRRADNEGRDDGDRPSPLPTAASETAEPSGIEEDFPMPRTRVSGAEAAATRRKAANPSPSRESLDDDLPLTAEEIVAADAFLENPPAEYQELIERVKAEINATGTSISNSVKPDPEDVEATRALMMADEMHKAPPLDGRRGEPVPKDAYEGDDITSLAHSELDRHRELREYMRIISWEMPKLMKLSKPFEPPSSDRPLRFRYTTYMGETHPAENKVVLEFCTADLPLKPAERLKLVKLVGRRYDPQTDLVKMSCESFSSQTQNKRYLGDLVGTLIQVAKGKGGSAEAKDSFADVPVDFRHVKWKYKPQFPEAWKMTPERQQLLKTRRAELAKAEQQRIQDGALVDGAQCIRESFQLRRPSAAQERAGASLQGRVDRITAGARGKARPKIRI